LTILLTIEQTNFKLSDSDNRQKTLKIALKMGKTILSAITESEGFLKAYNNGQFELLGTF
ncbi:TPA: hypothetical protein ACOFZ6_002859, partial [Staphylococcus aureus]